jgi:phosphotransacetylase
MQSTAAEMSDIQPGRHRWLRELPAVASAAGHAILTVALAYPCDEISLTAALAIAGRGLAQPILVGPSSRILATADHAGLDISKCRIVEAPDAAAAAARAVALVRAGEAELLMKGSLATHDFMRAVVLPSTGLTTGRRLSHVFVMDVPSYPRPILITDAAVNVAPDLEAKRDIVQNAIDLAHVLGIATPRVAILCAVETVNPAMPCTVDAAALSKMADRGQITGGLVDGPLAFDNAVSPAAARDKGIHSPVAGQADILVVPDLEAGNMLAKELSFMAGADSAGVVVGGRAPIVLTSRADSAHAHIAACAVAVMMARARHRLPPEADRP